jgi:hypothetical protein
MLETSSSRLSLQKQQLNRPESTQPRKLMNLHRLPPAASQDAVIHGRKPKNQDCSKRGKLKER